MNPAKHSEYPGTDSSIRILLVDDHPAVREGLALLLAPEGMEVCAEAEGCSDALLCVEKHLPTLAIVDLSLDGEDGRQLVADLYQHGLPVLIYSMHNDPHHVQSAMAAGAVGYVTKREFHDVLIQAIREVASGRRFVSPIAAAALAESMTQVPDDGGTGRLSPSEQKVYELLGQGTDTSDIAASLGVTNHTIESYYSRILIKLDLDGMRELRRHAINCFQK